jgi:hypothetical protein
MVRFTTKKKVLAVALQLFGEGILIEELREPRHHYAVFAKGKGLLLQADTLLALHLQLQESLARSG